MNGKFLVSNALQSATIGFSGLRFVFNGIPTVCNGFGIVIVLVLLYCNYSFAIAL